MSWIKKQKKSLVLLGVIIFFYVVITYNLPVKNEFIGADGYDYVGEKEIKPSGISDIHLRQRLKHHGEIVAVTVQAIGGVGGIYPYIEGQRPIFLKKHKDSIDVFVEPSSTHTRGIYIITVIYKDDQKEVTPIIP